MHTVSAHPTLKGQKALFASRALKKGERSLDLSNLPELKENNKYAVTVRRGLYLDTTGHDALYLNHSCAPNLEWCATSRSFIAIRDIEKNEMLTFDYSISEVDIAESFNCCCLQKNCRGLITSAT